EILFVGAHPQLALLVEFLGEILFVGAHPQLALLVEFLGEILFVGAPPSCKKWFDICVYF
ncbi:hypothetical protein K4S41_04390, partial [Staphylococcus epidermidis]|nr:hypothetical protein [Staphylococcus epidermidis]MCG2294217.1 hypothetical protein [Staphylococcus epidermidis]